MSKVHQLKTWPKYFQAVKSGMKNFEIRKNDRDFKVGDFLELSEYDPETQLFTESEKITKVITYISDSTFMPDGIVVLAIKDL